MIKTCKNTPKWSDHSCAFKRWEVDQLMLYPKTFLSQNIRHTCLITALAYPFSGRCLYNQSTEMITPWKSNIWKSGLTCTGYFFLFCFWRSVADKNRSNLILWKNTTTYYIVWEKMIDNWHMTMKSTGQVFLNSDKNDYYALHF